MVVPLKAFRFLLVAAALALWLSPARADCLSDFAYEVFLSDSGPAPAESLPCCGASVGPFLAAGKNLPTGDRSPAFALLDSVGRPHAAVRAPAGRLPSPPSRPYCARSSRLLL